MTEAVGLVGSLGNGVIKVGNHRLVVRKITRYVESANWIVDGALDGDTELLQLILDMDIVSSTGWCEQRSFIYTKHNKPGPPKDELEKYRKLTLEPTDTDSMRQYLKLLEEVDGLNSR